MLLLRSNGDLYAMASGVGILVRYREMETLGAVDGHFGAHDVAEAPDGTIWVADNQARRLVQYTPDLDLLKVIKTTWHLTCWDWGGEGTKSSRSISIAWRSTLAWWARCSWISCRSSC